MPSNGASSPVLGELSILLLLIQRRLEIIRDAFATQPPETPTPEASAALIDADKAAELLHINVRTLYRAARKPPLSEAAVWLSPRCLRFRPEALQRLLRERLR